VIILDAYSSDAVPVHLLTREALDLYLTKLAPGGILLFHISNTHLDLEPTLAALARRAGLVCLVQDDTSVSPAEAVAGKYESQWAVMARDHGDLGDLATDSRWKPARADPTGGVWTDDYSSLWPALKAAHQTPRSGREAPRLDPDRSSGDNRRQDVELR